jgi:hypothetical protein
LRVLGDLLSRRGDALLSLELDPEKMARTRSRIMLKQQAKVKCRSNSTSFRFSRIIAGAAVAREFRS